MAVEKIRIKLLSEDRGVGEFEFTYGTHCIRGEFERGGFGRINHEPGGEESLEVIDAAIDRTPFDRWVRALDRAFDRGTTWVRVS